MDVTKVNELLESIVGSFTGNDIFSNDDYFAEWIDSLSESDCDDIGDEIDEGLSREAAGNLRKNIYYGDVSAERLATGKTKKSMHKTVKKIARKELAKDKEDEMELKRKAYGSLSGAPQKSSHSRKSTKQLMRMVKKGHPDRAAIMNVLRSRMQKRLKKLGR